MIKKYSLWCEGKTDKYIFQNFKTMILENKTCRICKETRHNYNFDGTPTLDKIKKNSSVSWSCHRIVIIDKDKISDEKIEEMKNYSKDKKNNTSIIISDPCIEIVLYAIFNVASVNLNSNQIIEKLTNYLKTDSRFKFKYEKSEEIITKIFDVVRNDKTLKNQWFTNLKQLNKIGKSNFYEIINKFKPKAITTN